MSGFGIASEKVPTMKSLGGADNKKDQAAESAPVEEKKEEKIDFSKVEIEPLFKETL